ncbi:MAG: hypothetical protein AAFY21_08815, partial [Cyanobacteria bacterium J06641_2]
LVFLRLVSAETRRKNTKTSKAKTTTTSVGTINEGETKLAIELPNFDSSNRKETTVNPSINSSINYSKDGGITVDTPGFTPIKLDDVFGAVHIPNIQKIEDVKNPNIEGKATEAEHAKAIEEYKAGIRYQELVEWANNYIGSQYKALASAVKAATKGLNAATELERLNQQFIELQKQKKITQQKGFEYVEQSHKTAVIEQRVPYSAAEQIALLNKQKAKSEKAFHEAKSEEEKTRDFIANLGTNNTDKK